MASFPGGSPGYSMAREEGKTMRGRTGSLLAVVTLAAAGLAACGGDQGAMDETQQQAPAAEASADTGQEAVTLAEGATQEQFDQGRELFTGQGGCHACHGPQATGTQLAPDLTDSEWINISGRNMEEIAQLIHTGVPQPQEHPAAMPPMGGANLTDEQVQALAAYVASIGQG